MTDAELVKKIYVTGMWPSLLILRDETSLDKFMLRAIIKS